MPYKRKIQWFVIFSVLSLFSFSLLGNITGVSAQKVLAQTINSDSGLSEEEQFIIVEDDEAKSSGQSNGFLHKLANFMEKEKVCAVTQVQYEALDDKFDVSTDTITLGGEDVSLVKVSGQKLKAKDIKEVLGDGLKCKVIKSSSIFYLLASFHIS